MLVLVLVTAAATAAGWFVPVVGAPVAAVVLGAALSRSVRVGDRTLEFARGPVLQLAIVLLGAQLSLGQAAHLGSQSLPVMLGTLTVCLLLAVVLGRRLGISRDLRTLVGVGTAICGASAIAAVSPVIRARNPDIAYALSTIFLFNIAAVVTFPLLGHALHLSQTQFGLFAGTAVNDTSSVVAAATSYGDVAANHAVVVKLTRSLMIIPICMGLAAVSRSRAGITRLVPWFLVGFVAMAALRTAEVLPSVTLAPLQHAAVVLITVALAAIGLSTDVAALRRAGTRPLLLGFALWVAVAATSLCLQAITV